MCHVLILGPEGCGKTKLANTFKEKYQMGVLNMENLL